MVVIAVAAAKAQGIAELGHHRTAAAIVVGVALATRLVWFRAVAVAGLAGALVALVIAPHPLIAGFGLAVVAFVAILALMVGVATLLHAREGREARRRPASGRPPSSPV